MMRVIERQEKTGFETESISSALYFAKGQEIPFTEML